MIYKHGSHEYDVHVLDVTKTPRYNSARELISSTTRILIEGKVSGANQAALKTAILGLESDFAEEVTTSGLYHSDGSTASGHMIDIGSVDTENGIVATVRWVSPPQRAEYVTYRSFQVLVEATALGPGAEEFEYSNRIIRIGDGGPLVVPRLTLSGVVMQQAYPSTPFTGIETGRKVSRAGIVAVQSPTYPSLTTHPDRVRDTGVDKGPDGITRYFANWTYNLLSASAF